MASPWGTILSHRIPKYKDQPTATPKIPITQVCTPPLSRLISIHTMRTTIVAGNHAAVPMLPIAQQSGSSVNPQYPPQHYAVDPHQAGVLLNPGVPVHYQNYRPIERGQPVVPSQYDAHLVSPQKPYPNPPNPAIQTQGGHAQYSNPANSPSPPIGYGSPSPPSSSSCTAGGPP